jgi:hypothetical protein
VNRTKLAIGSCIIFSILFIVSCATTPTKLSTEFIDSINKITVVVEQKEDKLQVLDHTRVWNTQLTYGQFGAVGGLMEGVILGIAANNRIKKSLCGDPDILRDSVGDIEMDETVYENIKNRFVKRYEVLDGRDLRIKKHRGQFVESSIGQESFDGYEKTILDLYDLTGIDTFIKVDFLYGLAAYVGESASADIDADIEIWDVQKNKRLIKRRLRSDYLFKSGHTIEEFNNENASLFKKDINKAADSLALQIAATFGINVAERDSKVIIDTHDSTHMTCGKPYEFSQDCSNGSRAKRNIELHDRKMSISGSEDGKSILVMDEKYFSSSMKRAFSLGISDAGTDEALECGSIVESFFKAKNLKVVHKIKLIEMGSVVGFVFELEDDGYSLLKEYTIDKTVVENQ